VRRWQAHLDRNVGPATLAQCRSLALRIFQFATDEGAIDSNPIRKVPPPKRRVDPEEVFGEVKRRALTPEEAGRLLACFPLFWWDHMLTLLGTGLRFGELAGLRRRRVHLDRPIPVLEVGPTRYQAGRFGSGFKPRPKSDAGIRPVPLAPLVVEAIRRRLPPRNDPDELVFTGPGGGPAATDGPAPPAAPSRRRAPARLPTRRPAHRRWPPPDPSGHRGGRPGRAARCRLSRGRRPRPGRADRSVGGVAGRR
jgi:integrase